jgi:hypothetical protein
MKITFLVVMMTCASLASAQTWTPPRTPDGHPDLQGIWTNASITPLERPRDLGAKEYFTEAEAAENRKRALVPASVTQRSGTEAHYEFTQFGLDRTQAQVAFSLRTSDIRPRTEATRVSAGPSRSPMAGSCFSVRPCQAGEVNKGELE